MEQSSSHGMTVTTLSFVPCINLLTTSFRLRKQLRNTLGRALLNRKLVMETLYFRRWPAKPEQGCLCPLALEN